MAILLEIEKIAPNVFKTTIGGNVIISNDIKLDIYNQDIRVQSKQIDYHGTVKIDNVTLKDIQGVAETFTTPEALAIRLGELLYPGFRPAGSTAPPTGGSSLYLGKFLSQADLETAHPTGVIGNFAWIYDPSNSIDRRAIWNGTAWFYDLDFKKDASDGQKDVYYGSGDFFGSTSDGFSVIETNKGSTSVLQSILQYALGALIVTYWQNPANNFSNNWQLYKKNKEKVLTDFENTTVLIPDIDQSTGKTYNNKELSLVVTTDYVKKSDFPITGLTGVIYLALDVQLQYVWQFNNYFELAKNTDIFNKTIYVNTNQLNTLQSGGTTEQTVLSFLIPANTVNLDNFIELIFSTLRSATGYTYNTRMYLGTSINARTTLIKNYNNSSNNYSLGIRTILRLNNNGTLSFSNPNLTTNQVDLGDVPFATSPPTSVAFNRAIDNFVTITIQNSTSAVTSSLTSISAKIY